VANGERVRRWCQEKKAGWYAVLEDPQMPATSTLLDQAHKPTVSLDVISLVASSCGYSRGHIEPRAAQ